MPEPVVLHENPGDSHGYCGGRDETESECTCPDLVWTTRVRLKTYVSVNVITCFCCKLPVDRDHPFGRSTA